MKTPLARAQAQAQAGRAASGAVADPDQGFHAVRMALHALVRLAIGQGVTQQTLAAMSKRAYFEEGQDYAPIAQRSNSDSRVSVLTGLSRRDIRAMREAGPPPQTPPVHLNIRIANRWSERADLVDEQGARKRLARTRAVGGEQSWEALVESLSQEVRPRAVLDEWLRLQLAVVDERDCVVPVHQDGAELHPFAGENALNLFTASAFNILRACARRYEQAPTHDAHSVAHVVWGYGLSSASAQKVYALANARFRTLHNELNRLVVECETLDSGQADADQRVFMSLFARHVPIQAERMDPLTQSQAVTTSVGPVAAPPAKPT
jgi:Family of unknown function (DUF6502)